MLLLPLLSHLHRVLVIVIPASETALAALGTYATWESPCSLSGSVPLTSYSVPLIFSTRSRPLPRNCYLYWGVAALCWPTYRKNDRCVSCPGTICMDPAWWARGSRDDTSVPDETSGRCEAPAARRAVTARRQRCLEWALRSPSDVQSGPCDAHAMGVVYV